MIVQIACEMQNANNSNFPYLQRSVSSRQLRVLVRTHKKPLQTYSDPEESYIRICPSIAHCRAEVLPTTLGSPCATKQFPFLTVLISVASRELSYAVQHYSELLSYQPVFSFNR